MLNAANYYWSTRDMDPTNLTAMTCTTNAKYCFDVSKAFTCQTGYFLDTSAFTCATTCPLGTMVGKGLNVNKGYCNSICTSAGCNITGPKTFTCNTGYIQMYENCVLVQDTNTYKYTDWRSGLYYSYFLRPPTINIQPTTINSIYTFKNYYLEFWWMYETNSLLVPTNTENYIFATNCATISHNNGASSFYLRYPLGPVSPASITGQVDLTNWNKFTIKITGTSGNYIGSLYINNKFSTAAGTFSGVSDCSLSAIVFCHLDSSCSAGNIAWSSGYYKNLRIWDSGTYKINDNMVWQYGVYDNL